MNHEFDVTVKAVLLMRIKALAKENGAYQSKQPIIDELYSIYCFICTCCNEETAPLKDLIGNDEVKDEQ
jgi:hypothetical protein